MPLQRPRSDIWKRRAWRVSTTRPRMRDRGISRSTGKPSRTVCRASRGVSALLTGASSKRSARPKRSSFCVAPGKAGASTHRPLRDISRRRSSGSRKTRRREILSISRTRPGSITSESLKRSPAEWSTQSRATHPAALRSLPTGAAYARNLTRWTIPPLPGMDGPHTVAQGLTQAQARPPARTP